MPTVAAIGISAGVGLYSAHKQAKTAKEAAQTQIQAVDKGMDFSRETQDRQLQFLREARSQPYQAPPAGSPQNYLSRMMGLPQQTPYALKQPAPMGAQGGYGQLLSPGGASGMPSMGSAGLAGGMVMLEAPTGERKSVPAAQAQALIAKGARRVQ